MILRNLDIEHLDPSQFNVSIPRSIGWDTYYEQYKKVLCFLISHPSSIGIRFMSLLLVFRHTVELFLKKQISTVELTHSLNELYNKTQGLPLDFLQKLSVLRCDNDGSDFRYLHDKDGNPYFNGEILQLLEPLKYFISLEDNNVDIVNKPKGKFEIHTSLLRTMGHISTDYDESMCLIYEGIKQGELSINEVFLPFLFIIRHSIELSLKQNLIDASAYLSEKDLAKIMNEHSLCSLFNKFDTIISQALQNMQKDNNEDFSDFKKHTEEYHEDLKVLQQIIHDTDYNSYYYRFPIDREGNPYNLLIDGKKLIALLTLRDKVDAYLTYAVPLLQEYGYLNISDENM